MKSAPFNLFLVFLIGGILAPLSSQEYKVVLSSVLHQESAEYLSAGFRRDSIATVFETANVRGRTFIRILTAETYADYESAQLVRSRLGTTPFIRAQGIHGLWIRVYPAGDRAAGYVSPEPVFRQEMAAAPAAGAPAAQAVVPAVAPATVQAVAPAVVPAVAPATVPARPTEAPTSAPKPAVVQAPKPGTPAPAAVPAATLAPQAAPTPAAPAPPPETPVVPATPTLPDRPASTDPLDVFNHHKAHLPATYEFLRRFTDERDTAEAIRMAESAPLFIQLAEQMLEDFEAHIPKPLSNFERTNPEARELRLATSTSFIEGRYLPRSRQRLVSLKSDILRAVAGDVEWLSSSHATIRYAPAAMNRIEEGFHALDRIAPGDEEVAERRNALMPVALQAYQGLSARVADARMPAGQYSGDDRTALEATMKELYEARYPGQTVLRVVITSEEWREQAAAEIRDDRIVAGVYRYIQTALAATTGADPAMVYTLGFRRTWSGRGDDFGPPELHSIGGSYPILSVHVTP